MSRFVIGNFMTAGAHTIGPEQPLEAAHQLMRRLQIRHLPVVNGGRLIGMLSLGDLHLIETLKGVNPKEVEIADAMSPVAYAVAPGTPIEEVAMAMAEHKYGAATVVNGNHIVGVFTTTDALRALVLLAAERCRPRPPRRKENRP